MSIVPKLFLAVAAVIAAHPALAERRGPFLALAEQADAPQGFIEMCARDRVLCAAGLPLSADAQLPRCIDRPSPCSSGAGTAAIGIAPARPAAAGRGDRRDRHRDPALRLLKDVTRQVHRRVVQVSDFDATGSEERWDRPAAGRHPTGDCEDLAIEKRMLLIAAGFAPEKLSFAVVYVPGVGLHTILIARLSDGDRVLDSLTPRVLRWSQPRYVWLRQQVPGRPLEWRRVAPA